MSWQAYYVNGYTFYTKAKDHKSVSQNSGVRIENVDAFGEVHTHYGFIEDIWELDFGSDIQITLFRCQWVKKLGGIEVEKFGLTRVNLDNVGYKDHRITRGCLLLVWHRSCIMLISRIQRGMLLYLGNRGS